jgi:putative oxidoreductase
MCRSLIKTEKDIVPLILRVVLGIIFYFHGMQKLTTLYGGFGFSGTMGYFTQKLGIPEFFAFLAIMAEGLGWAGLISGFLTRIAAFAITVNMIVAVKMLHWQNGFFMNWYGNQKGEGFEYHLLVIAIGFVLMIRGGGTLSLDRALSKK